MFRSREDRETPLSIADELQLRELTLHGQQGAYRTAGDGPVIFLIHGITSNSATWGRVLPTLARRFTVIAPDLIGHGASDKPKGDYSLGAHASTMRGLGREVNVLLRAATLPGSEFVLPLLAATRLLDLGRRAGGLLGQLGLRAGTDIEEIARGHATLSDPETRAAFVHTLRSVVEPGGQRVDAVHRMHMAGDIPLLLIWGERDSVIPIAHGRAAHELVPGSRFEVFPKSGHFPQLDEPERVIEVLGDFIDSVEPADFDHDQWRKLFTNG
jgi:pimeloyl-ACP methyl ester carboxylesterase